MIAADELELVAFEGAQRQVGGSACPDRGLFPDLWRCIPLSHFWVEPEILPKLVNAVKAGKMSMVIAPHQFGKTSVAQRMRGLVQDWPAPVEWSITGHAPLAVLLVCLSGETPLDPAGFLHWLHQRLHLRDRHRIRGPRPLPLGATPTEAEEAAREDLLQAVKPHAADPRAYAIIVDGADFLDINGKDGRKQAHCATSAFLDILKESHGKPDYAVYSVTLLGVDSLRSLLHDTHQLADQQHALEQHEAGISGDSSSAMQVEKSSDSDLGRNWTLISSFSVDHLFELDSFSVAQIADLLRQYTVQQREVAGHISPLDVEALPQIIYERTGGFPGLVEMSCSEVSSRVIRSPNEWFQWCGADLAYRVQLQHNYWMISETVAMLTTCDTWDRLRVLLRDLLLHNRCVAKRSERRPIVNLLLAKGLARVFNSNDALIELEVRSPLLRNIMLMEARFKLQARPPTPNRTELDMQWVLREAFRRVDIRNIKAATAGAKSSPFSENIWHGELFPLIKAIINKAYSWLPYRIVTEALALPSIHHNRKRIDMVMIGHQCTSRLPAHGVETLTCGSEADVEEAYNRALRIYQPFYSVLTGDGVPLPSTIQMGFCSGGGDGYKWQPEHEAEPVNMVHVMLCNDGRDAVITWSDKWEQTDDSSE
ncbi:g10610 [Coccomyxa elongata]